MRSESMLIWRGGLFTGLIGYGTIVGFFGALNLYMLRLHPFLQRELKEIQMGEVPQA